MENLDFGGWFQRSCWHGFAEQGGAEFFFGWDAGEGGLVAAGGVFPEGEVVGVGFKVAAQGGGLDAVRVAGVAFGIDELVVAGPIRAGFGFEEGREDDDAAVALAEVAEHGLGIAGKQQVG